MNPLEIGITVGFGVEELHTLIVVEQDRKQSDQKYFQRLNLMIEKTNEKPWFSQRQGTYRSFFSIDRFDAGEMVCSNRLKKENEFQEVRTQIRINSSKAIGSPPYLCYN